MELLSYEYYVDYYAAIIRDLCPHALPILGGWSRGGTVAAALAAHFEFQNMAPRGLILIDSFTRNLRFKEGVTLGDIYRDPAVATLKESERLELDNEINLVRFDEYIDNIRVQSKCIYFKSRTETRLREDTTVQIMLNKYLEIPVTHTERTNGFDEILRSVEVVPISAEHRNMVSFEAADAMVPHVRRAYHNWHKDRP